MSNLKIKAYSGIVHVDHKEHKFQVTEKFIYKDRKYRNSMFYHDSMDRDELRKARKDTKRPKSITVKL